MKRSRVSRVGIPRILPDDWRSEAEVDPAEVAVNLDLVVTHPLGKYAEVGREHPARAHRVRGALFLGRGVGRGDAAQVRVHLDLRLLVAQAAVDLEVLAD